MEEEGQTLGVMTFVFPHHHYTPPWHGSPFSWEWLNACLPACPWEMVNYIFFSLFECMAIASPIKIFLPQPMSFLGFTPLIFSFIPL